MLRSKFVKFLMSILKRQVDSSPNLYPSSVSWEITPLYVFSSNNIHFAQKESIKVNIFEIFKYSGQNSLNSYCQLWNKSIPLQILHQSSLLWQITPLDFKLRVFQLWIKGSHQNPNFENFKCSGEICHIPYVTFQTSHLKVMLDKSVNNVLGEGM